MTTSCIPAGPCYTKARTQAAAAKDGLITELGLEAEACVLVDHQHRTAVAKQAGGTNTAHFDVMTSEGICTEAQCPSGVNERIAL